MSVLKNCMIGQMTVLKRSKEESQKKAEQLPRHGGHGPASSAPPPPSSRAASGSASRSRGRSAWTRRSSSSTSRPPRSTRRWSASVLASHEAIWPKSGLHDDRRHPRDGLRPVRSPPASSSWTAASSSRRARPSRFSPPPKTSARGSSSRATSHRKNGSKRPPALPAAFFRLFVIELFGLVLRFAGEVDAQACGRRSRPPWERMTVECASQPRSLLQLLASRARPSGWSPRRWRARSRISSVCRRGLWLPRCSIFRFWIGSMMIGEIRWMSSLDAAERLEGVEQQRRGRRRAGRRSCR